MLIVVHDLENDGDRVFEVIEILLDQIFGCELPKIVELLSLYLQALLLLILKLLFLALKALNDLWMSLRDIFLPGAEILSFSSSSSGLCT